MAMGTPSISAPRRFKSAQFHFQNRNCIGVHGIVDDSAFGILQFGEIDAMTRLTLSSAQSEYISRINSSTNVLTLWNLVLYNVIPKSFNTVSIYIHSGAVKRGPIYHDITIGTMMTAVERKSDI